MVKTSNDGQWQRLSDLTFEGCYKMIPEMFGQSSICSAWKTSSSFLMPPCHRSRKVARLPPPPSSPPRAGESDRRYEASSLGGDEVKVASLLKSYPVWTPEVVHELLECGAIPKLVELNHSYLNVVNCTFAHPNGTLVRNVFVPLSVLKYEYAEQTSHL